MPSKSNVHAQIWPLAVLQHDQSAHSPTSKDRSACLVSLGGVNLESFMGGMELAVSSFAWKTHVAKCMASADVLGFWLPRQRSEWGGLHFHREWCATNVSSEWNHWLRYKSLSDPPPVCDQLPHSQLCKRLRPKDPTTIDFLNTFTNLIQLAHLWHALLYMPLFPTANVLGFNPWEGNWWHKNDRPETPEQS